MDSERQQYPPASQANPTPSKLAQEAGQEWQHPSSGMEKPCVEESYVEESVVERSYPSSLDGSDSSTILQCIHRGQVWVINSRRRNGLILYKPFHAEFAGPGAAVGGSYDQDCRLVIPVGNLVLARPESHNDRQNAYLIRRQWIKLTQQFTDQSSPAQRAQMILNQFETYFDQQTIARVPDEAFAMLVGVLPYSVRMARRPPGKMNIKVKSK